MDNRPSRSDCVVRMKEKPLPVDLSHYFSEVTKRRTASKIKGLYRFFAIPGIRNLAGGMPNAQFFPFDTLEAQTAKPERWTPSSTKLEEINDSTSAKTGSSDPAAAAHITVPALSDESNLSKRVDVATGLQYGQASGYPPMLAWVRKFTREHLHPEVPYRDGPEVTLTCGSTDGFAKTLEMFVNPWIEGVHDIRDRPGMLCENFIYAMILTQTEPKGIQMAPVNTDGDGMLASGPGGLEDVLANWDESKGKRPHLMYTVTLGHNPTGIVIPMERRKEIYAICRKYDIIIIEDEPYWYMQFPSAVVEEAKSRSQPVTDEMKDELASRVDKPFLESLTPSYLSIDTDGRVVRLDTFSKTVAPGCRLGWVTAQPALIEKFIRISETSTQQPSGFVQSLVAELVMGPGSPEAAASPSSAQSTVFQRLLRTTTNDTKPSTTTTTPGWQMDGWVRWLEGLRGSYERRMATMCRILDAGCSPSSPLSLLPTTTTVTTPNPHHPLTCDDDTDTEEWELVVLPSPTARFQNENDNKPYYTFSWPRGGMFIWLRMHFENHPLFQAPRKGVPGYEFIDGPLLSTALMIYLTRETYRVLVSPGAIFSANQEVAKSDEGGWTYYRLCFAAEEDERVAEGAERFVDGVRAFWGITDPKEIEDIVKDIEAESAAADMAIRFDATWLGC